MLAAGERMFAYQFDGYWKDVGTISSLWEANMDLLGETPVFDVADPAWKIHSRNPLAPPEYIGAGASVQNSMVALGCEICGEVKNSVLSNRKRRRGQRFGDYERHHGQGGCGGQLFHHR